MVWHRSIHDRPGVIYQAVSIKGELAAVAKHARCVAASSQSLVIAGADGRLWSVHVRVPDPQSTRRWAYAVEPRVNVPEGLKTLQVAATPGRVYVLGEGSVDATLFRQQPEQPQGMSEQAFRSLVLKLPPPEVQAPDDKSPEAAPSEAPTTPAAQPAAPDKLEGVLLFELDGVTWRHIPLPEAFRADRRHFLVASDAAPLTLLQLSDPTTQEALDAATPDEPVLGRLEIFRYNGERWRTATAWLPMPGSVISDAAAVGDQLILGEPAGTLGRQLYLVRQVATAVRPTTVYDLGTLRIEADASQVAGVSLLAQAGRRAELIAMKTPAKQGSQAADLPVVYAATMAMDGETAQLKPLELEQISRFTLSADQLLGITAIGIAVVLIVLFWPQEARRGPLKLPADIELASFSRRFAAGVVDLAPPVLVVLLLYGFSAESLGIAAMTSPNAPRPEISALAQMMPALIVIVLFVLHTMTSELLWQVTLGKRVFGLKVVMFDGRKPGAGPLVVRNVLRALDLIAPLLLVLPLLLLWPKRQRLGDLVAGTVVVQPKTETPADDAEGEDF